MGGRLMQRQDHLGFLAEFMANLQQAQQRPGISSEERGRFSRWIEHAQALEELLGGPASKAHSLTVADAAADLPAALLKELKGGRSDELERQILAVLAACGGRADLDQVLIGLYRGFGIIQKRRVLQNKLWRLVRTGRIAKAKDRRNVFALNAPAERSRRAQRKKRGR